MYFLFDKYIITRIMLKFNIFIVKIIFTKRYNVSIRTDMSPVNSNCCITVFKLFVLNFKI